MNPPLNYRISQLVFLVLGLMVIGTLGYVWIEGWQINDGLFMTIITMSTVGYGETNELSQIGRLFTLFLILMSVVSMSCMTAGLTSLIVGGDLSGAFVNRKANKMAARMKNHTIICGSGSVAQSVLDQLVRECQSVVMVDDQEQRVQEIRQRYPSLSVVLQSPKNELVLAKVNILEASNVVAATDSDFDNMLIAMTCKELDSSIRVFAVSDDRTVIGRMAKMGVDEVICPHQIGGEKIADLIST